MNFDKKKQIKLSDENKNKVKWYLNTIKKIQNNEALLQQEYFLNAQEVLQALNISDKDFEETKNYPNYLEECRNINKKFYVF